MANGLLLTAVGRRGLVLYSVVVAAAAAGLYLLGGLRLRSIFAADIAADAAAAVAPVLGVATLV